jgi:hypothetical protein
LLAAAKSDSVTATNTLADTRREIDKILNTMPPKDRLAELKERAKNRGKEARRRGERDK